jgi:hypothetical protein
MDVPRICGKGNIVMSRSQSRSYEYTQRMISSGLEEWVGGDASTSLPTDCFLKGFCRDVVVWKALRHPNVLPLLGVTMTENRFVMASEWMVKGDINEFVKANVNADRLELVRFSFRVLAFISH